MFIESGACRVVTKMSCNTKIKSGGLGVRNFQTCLDSAREVLIGDLIFKPGQLMSIREICAKSVSGRRIFKKLLFFKICLNNSKIVVTKGKV